MNEKSKKVDNTGKTDVDDNKESSKKDNTNATEFKASRLRGSAITWFVCALLLIPCFIETRIWSMILMVPILIVLGVGFWKESAKNQVAIENGQLLIQDASGFRNRSEKVIGKKIVTALVDSTTEKDHEIIHSIRLITTSGPVSLPDVDDKNGLLNRLKSLKPNLKVDKPE